MQADKGFVFGHTDRGDHFDHCPEVDILVHNPHILAPMFRLEDFVIARAEATLGLIQVKKTLDKSKVKAACANVAEAKWHVVKMLCGNVPTITMNDVRLLYAGVVGMTDTFEGQDKDNEERVQKISDAFKDALTETSTKYPPFPVRRNDPTGVSMLPQFIGSLNDHFALLRPHSTVEKQTYYVHKSVQQGKNIAIQALLYSLASCVFPPGAPKPVFDFPHSITHIAGFTVEQKVTVRDE
jgi:hypothetical protein